MFGNNVASSTLTFGKILGGISKTLSIANQVIPLYQQAKPMINNAKTIMSALKDLNNSNAKNKETSQTILNSLKNAQSLNTNTTTITNINSPTFFQ